MKFEQIKTLALKYWFALPLIVAAFMLLRKKKSSYRSKGRYRR